MDQSQGYCLTGGAELCPIQALFLAPRGRGRKQRKELLFSVEPSPGKDLVGLLGQREGCHCGSKDPRLERSWRGAVVQGEPEWGPQNGAPSGLVHTPGTH